MKSYPSVLLVLLLIFCFNACKNDPGQNSQETELHKAKPLDTKGKVASIVGNKINIGDGSPIDLPAEGDLNTAAIFFVRHAEENVEGKTALAPEGQARAAWLAVIFSKNSGLSSAYAVDNASLQTGLPAARANECPFNVYQADNPEAFVKSLLQNGKGKRTLVVSTAELIPTYLNLLTGQQTFQAIPASEYDNLYLAIAQDLGKTEVKQLKY